MLNKCFFKKPEAAISPMFASLGLSLLSDLWDKVLKMLYCTYGICHNLQITYIVNDKKNPLAYSWQACLKATYTNVW